MKSLEIVNALLKHKNYFTLKEMETIKQDLEKLGKLEKAFDIFKRLINDRFAYVNLEYGVFDGTIDITEEEVELLEELMKSE